MYGGKEYYSIRNKYFLIGEFKNNVIIRTMAYTIITLKILKLMIAAAIKPKYKGYHKVRLKDFKDGCYGWFEKS